MVSIYNAATYDSLTGVYNRSKAQKCLDDVYAKSINLDKSYLLALIDVDNFKHINDGYGHAAGDEALQFIAKKLSELLRSQDVICRWGGEEFLVLLPETDMQTGCQLLNQLIEKVSDSPVVLGDEIIYVTLTVGVAESIARNNDELIKLADKALYQGKENGKNCVVPI